MLSILAAAAAAAAATAPAPAPQAVEAIEVVTRREMVGTLQQGVQAYRGEFFTAVRPGTAMDMIQWLPGFTFDDTRDLRGLGGAGGNVLIDGQPPTSKNETLAAVLRRIPATQVDRVDIIVGGAPGIDMRGRSVIANVVLKKTGAPKGTITGSSQLFQDGRVAPELMITRSHKDGDKVTEAALTLAKRVVQGTGPGKGPLVRRAPDGTVLFAADSVIGGTQLNGMASASHQFPWARGKLRFNGSATYNKVDADERADVIGSPALYSIKIVDTFRQGELGARYERAFGRLNLESQALQRLNGHSQSVDTVRPPVLTSLDGSDTLSESVLRSTLRFNKSPRLTLEASVEGAYNHLDTKNQFRSAGRIIDVPAANVTVSERRGEVGTLVTWKPSATFSMTTALKVETSDLTASGDVNLNRDLTYVKPRALIAWSPDGKTQIRLRGEHEVSQISFNNFVAQADAGTGQVRAGNPDLKPRRAWVAEATLERQLWTGASLVLTVRQSALRDVVDQLPLRQYGGATAIGNIGGGDQTELQATITLPLKRLGLDGVNLKGGASWRWSEVTDPTTGMARRISGQSASVADVHFSHDLPRWKLTWGVDAFHNAAVTVYQPTNVQHVSSFTRVNLFVEYRLRTDLNLRLEANNVNDPHPVWVVETYPGLRGVAPLSYTETRKPGDGAYLFFRVRKTLN